MTIRKVQSVNSPNNSSPLINARTTGYASVAGMGMAAISGVVKDRSMNKCHKYFAAFSALSMFAHIYLVTGWQNKKFSSDK